VFENRVLRKLFGSKKCEMTGRSRNLHDKELLYLNSSLSTIKIIKSRRIRLTGRVTRIVAKTNAYILLVRKPEETSRKTKT
jgi:hypothetical protein